MITVDTVGLRFYWYAGLGLGRTVVLAETCPTRASSPGGERARGWPDKTANKHESVLFNEF